MRRATLFLLTLTAAATAKANEHPAALVGRWRSENMPVGYWVIDRYSDGRLAQKQYMRDYSDQPAEITATWGRWRVRGKTYEVFFESATSKNARAYAGKWFKMQIQQITPTRFYHLSGDGHDTFEDRFPDRRPLLSIQQPRPKEYGWKQLLDTIATSKTAIPSWVNSFPPQPST
jgi:hypothetical protein